MKCSSCGGTMRYDVASYGCVCDFCGFTKKLHRPEEGVAVGEFDFNSALGKASSDWGITQRLVTCKQCGAIMLYDSDQMSGMCPFCGSAIVLTEQETLGIAPSAIIPFSVTKEQVAENFYKWNKFAFWSPESFRKGKVLGNLTGVYIPYWTFDTNTVTTYSGRFGYTTTTSDGGTSTRWSDRSGIVEKFMNDVCICASRKFLNDKMLNGVAKFDAKELIPYTPEALAGFAAEKYTVGIDEAFNYLKSGAIKNNIEYAARKNESADCYQKLQLSTEYSDVKYKLVLVPMWLTACVYRGQVYNVAASGHSNRGNCNRPVSTLKIVLLILIILGIFGAPFIFYIIMMIARIIGAG